MSDTEDQSIPTGDVPGANPDNSAAAGNEQQALSLIHI